MVLSKPQDSATVWFGFVRVHAPRVQRVVHPWTSGERQLSLQLWASFWASLHFLNWYSGWSQSSPCPSSAATKCRPIATDAVSILRGLMHTCAQLRRPYGAHKKKKKSLQRLSFFYFYASLKCFLRIMVMCLVRMCLHVWVWNHALVYMWLLWNLRKTLSVNTAGPGSSNLGFSDSPVLFTCVVSSCRWTASVSIFVLDLPFLSWHKHFVVLQQSICLLSERGLYTFKWAWDKTEVPTHPVG